MGKKKSLIADEFKIPRSTLSTILKNKLDIKRKIDERPNLDDAKRMRLPVHDNIEKAVYKWFTNLRANNIPISGPLLQQKARDFALIFGNNDFSASSGWLQRFKDRYGIVGKIISGEKQAVDIENVQEWLGKNWPAMHSKYQPCDIFNADETALFWKLLPNKTLSLSGEKCHGGKLSKVRVTILFAANLDGSEKLKPLVIGKSKSPRCFKQCKDLPVTYTYNSKAWMTGKIFSDWLTKWDSELIKQGRKICLLIDNCSAHHCDVKLSNIELKFLPPNATSVIQPLDQGIIHSFKCGYRKRVVENQIINLRLNMELNIDLLSAIEMINGAWKEVSKDTIKNCFRHAGFHVDRCSINGDENSINKKYLPDVWEELCAETDLKTAQLEEFLEIDDRVQICAEETDQEIVDEILGKNSSEVTIQDEFEEEKPLPTLKETLQAADILKRYCSSIEADGYKFVQNIQSIENGILKHAISVMKQTKITDFFVS